MGERERVTLSIAATHALSFTFFPGWIRKHIRFETLGSLNLISDSMEACEQIMLGGEVHFLLCHYHADAPPHFEVDRFQSLLVGRDILVPVCSPDAESRLVWPLPSTPERPVRLLAYSQSSGLGRILVAHPRQGRNRRPGNGLYLPSRRDTAGYGREGHGIAWLPLTIAEEDLTSGRLVRAGPEQFDIPVEIRLFRAPDGHNNASDELWNLSARDTTRLHAEGKQHLKLAARSADHRGRGRATPVQRPVAAVGAEILGRVDAPADGARHDVGGDGASRTSVSAVCGNGA